MRKFPGYTAELMLDEYGLRFFALIEQSLKLDAIDLQQQLVIGSVPHMDEMGRNEVMANLQEQSYDILEDLQQPSSSSDELKKAFED